MTYDLNLYESYIVFIGLKNILNKNISVHSSIRLNNVFIINGDSFSFSNHQVKFLLDKKVLINNKKIKWLNELKITTTYIIIKFNPKILEELPNDFFNFIKNIDLKYNYVSTLKLLEFNYLNKNELLLSDLRSFDNTIDSLKFEIANQYLLCKKEINKNQYENNIELSKTNKSKLNRTISVYKEISKYKKDDVFHYNNHFETIKNDIINYGYKLLYKFDVNKNNEYIIKFKLIKKSLKINNSKIENLEKEIKNITNIINNVYINDRDNLHRFKLRNKRLNNECNNNPLHICK